MNMNVTKYKGSDKLAFIQLMADLLEDGNKPPKVIEVLKSKYPEVDTDTIAKLIEKTEGGYLSLEEVIFEEERSSVATYQRQILEDKLHLHDCIEKVFEIGVDLEEVLSSLEELDENLNTFDLAFIYEVIDDLEVQAEEYFYNYYL